VFHLGLPLPVGLKHLIGVGFFKSTVLVGQAVSNPNWPNAGGFGSSLAQRRLRPTPIGAVLLATLGLRSASPHSAAFAPAVQRSLGGQLNFRHWAHMQVLGIFTTRTRSVELILLRKQSDYEF
jgi:hypothetical protein